MRITRIDMWHVAVPLPAPFRPSWIPGFPQHENRFDLIRLGTAGGLEGWCAAPAMGREREGWGQLLGSYFLGERADDIASIRQRVREMAYLGHRGGGLVEPACWDIVGKARDKPVWALLGGSGGDVRLYASTGEVRSGRDRVAEIEARLAEGFDCVKLRVHADTLEEDVEQIRTAREAVGDAVKLGVDANMAWRVAAIADCARWDYDRALRFCEAAQDLGYTWVEEPLPMDDYAAMARLRAATSLKIAGGELNNQGLPEFGHMIAAGCYDWYQPDAIMTGGVAETKAIIDRVVASGAEYSPHTWTNGVGFAVNLQLFAASPRREGKHLEYPLDPPGWVPEARDGLLREPFLHDRGALTIPETPGLGFEIDPRQLRRYGRRFFTATPLRMAVTTVLDRGVSLAKHLGSVRNARLAARSAALDEHIAAGGDPVADAMAALEASALGDAQQELA